jgi:hypothetical protein
MSVVADSLSAIRYAKVKVIRDETGLVTDYELKATFQSSATMTIESIIWLPGLSRPS